ncbi:sugar nucleotide-binding protein [Solwaraspora sp. WMMB762]|uniref:sugar nucleotide-binding protein n=1 Tax=Solwaraspora sp. WMMB762 TaxID=3404120 RepID=UPI003B94BF04
MRLLVVGGSGFLGREIVRQTRCAGHRVAATFHRRPPSGDLGAGVDWHALDIRIRDDVARVAATARPDVIVNAAYRQSDWASTADGGAHVALAAALRELAGSPYPGIHHVAGPDAISRHRLGVLIARRDGLDPTALPTGRRAASGVPGPAELRLDCARTRARLTTRLRGAHEFLAAGRS